MIVRVSDFQQVRHKLSAIAVLREIGIRIVVNIQILPPIINKKEVPHILTNKRPRTASHNWKIFTVQGTCA